MDIFDRVHIESWFAIEVATKMCTSSVQQVCHFSSSIHSQPGCIVLYIVLNTQQEKNNAEKIRHMRERQPFYYPTCGDIAVCIGDCFVARHS